jgi:ABC-2 type transport system ATP-binding protein
MTSPAIEAHRLRRTFFPFRRMLRNGPEVTAVDGVDLEVPAGTVFGLLGPNGAGKTTTIKILSTLLLPTSGSARVAGFDVVRHEREVRRRLGVLFGGDRGLYGKLSATDNLRYFAVLYGVPARDVERRVSELLEAVGLDHRAGQRVEGFSRGMKQRLHLAKALVHEPEVVFLDEPTIGLDPDAAIHLREIVKNLVPNHTVLLTTHYLHEADELCDRIAIIDQGRIIAEDTPAGIKRRVGGDRRFSITVDAEIEESLVGLLSAQPEVISASSKRAPARGQEILEVALNAGDRSLDSVIRQVLLSGHPIVNIESREVTLEEAFLALTRNSPDCTAPERRVAAR